MKFISAVLFLLFVSAALGQPQSDYVYDYDDGEETVEQPLISTLPTFTDETQTFTPRVGETVVLPCRSTDNSDQVLIINKLKIDDQPIFVGAAPMIFYNKNRISLQDSQITIKDVRKMDSGSYQCKFQDNLQNSVTLTHVIDVLLEPKILRKNKAVVVEKGQTIELFCNATGNPEPTITWTKTGDAENMDQVGPVITFVNVTRHDAGSFICTADNGVGNAVTGDRQVTVHYAPEVSTEKDTVHTGEGDKVELSCVVHASPSAEVEWLHNGSPVTFDTLAEVHEGGHMHSLTLEKVTENDFGTYECVADNNLGTTYKSIKVTNAPSNPEITSDPHSAMEDSYTLTFSTESYYPISEYKLMYRKTKANESTDLPGEWMETEGVDLAEQAAGVQTFKHTLEELDRATDYDARLYVKNMHKSSQDTEFSFFTRKAPPPTPSQAESITQDKEETADHQSTSGAAEASVLSSLLLISYCLVFAH